MCFALDLALAGIVSVLFKIFADIDIQNVRHARKMICGDHGKSIVTGNDPSAFAAGAGRVLM